MCTSARDFVDQREHQWQPFQLVLDNDETDELYLKQIANELVARDSSLQNIFGNFMYFYVFCITLFYETRILNSILNPKLKHPQTKKVACSHV